MPRMNRIDRVIMKGVEQLTALEKRAQAGEANNPAVGEIMYDRTRDARAAMARAWPNMTPEERAVEIDKAGGTAEFMAFLGGGK